MFDDKVILCGSSSYEKIFYFNPEFDSLPKQIKEELQIMCVLFTEDVGGILRLEFDERSVWKYEHCLHISYSIF